MKVQEEQFFHEIAIESINDSIVILDIDGTLTCSSSYDVERRVLDVVRKLQEKNTVYVFPIIIMASAVERLPLN